MPIRCTNDAIASCGAKLRERGKPVSKRCIAKTLLGKRCTFDALEESNYCRIHGRDAMPVFPTMVARRVGKKAAKKSAKKR
jgi:hypothetical protein